MALLLRRVLNEGVADVDGNEFGWAVENDARTDGGIIASLFVILVPPKLKLEFPAVLFIFLLGGLLFPAGVERRERDVPILV